MTLITRCPACTTMFKVLTDQIRVSDGWVRCGHCDGVFDASAHLQVTAEDALEAPAPVAPSDFDLDAQAASAALSRTSFLTAPAAPEAIVRAESAPASSAAGGHHRDEFAHPREMDSQILSSDTLIKPSPLSSFLSAPTADDASEPPRSHLLRAGSDAKLASEPGPAKRRAVSRPRQTVSFVDAAQRPASRRLGRSLWALVLAGLLSALLVQVLLHERDTLASRYPPLLPLLETLCRPWGCQVAPPKAIEAIVIDSSSFTQTAPDTYRLQLVLKNSRSSAVAMPALEVTLTGAQDAVVLRKVLLPAEFGASHAALDHEQPFAGVIDLVATAAAAASLPQAAELASATVAETPAAAASSALAVTGYRLSVFYP